MISLDYRNGAASLQVFFQHLQRFDWMREMFQDKTDKNVVEELCLIMQIENVGLFEFNIGQACLCSFSSGFNKRGPRYIN